MEAATLPEDISTRLEGAVGIVELRRPPNNFFTVAMIREIADALAGFDADPACRAVVLQAEGRHFCSGADFSEGLGGGLDRAEGEAFGARLYAEARRLFATGKPIVAAIQGAAIGGGLGLSLAADFRVCCPEARFSANFSRLGFHPGFGLTVTLPRLVGPQAAALLLYTGRRVDGRQAREMGLADLLVPRAELREAAMGLAREIAGSGPLAVAGIRSALRPGLAESVAAAMERESAQQARLSTTDDFREGVAAMAERREPVFRGC